MKILSLKLRNIDLSNVEAIFLTHEHTDHISGLKVFISKYNPDIKIFGSYGTIRAIQKLGYLNDKNNIFEIKSNRVDLEFAEINSFAISHDCAEGLGYTFTSKSGLIYEIYFIIIIVLSLLFLYYTFIRKIYIFN